MAKPVEERVKEIIVEQLGVEEDEVNPNAKFIEDLGADSLDTVELVMALEEEFDIEIPDEDAEKMTTVQSAIEYLMVYGFALVVVVIAMAALSNVANPGQFQGNRCDIRFGGFVLSLLTCQCVGHHLTAILVIPQLINKALANSLGQRSARGRSAARRKT